MAGTGCLLETALTRQKLQTAWKRVKASKGAPGVDGLDVEQTGKVLQTKRTDIRSALRSLGVHQESPARRKSWAWPLTGSAPYRWSTATGGTLAYICRTGAVPGRTG